MQITEAESHIMEALWLKAPLTADEIVVAVASQNWGAATVKTLIHRLLKKKLIRPQRNGARYDYWPTIARTVYVHAESKNLLDRLFDGQLTPMVSHFAEHGQLKPREIARLRALIEKLDGK